MLGRYSRLERFQKRLERLQTTLAEAESRETDGDEGWQAHALARRLSAVDQAQLVQDYMGGDGCTVLSRRYGISENGALLLLKRVGVVLRPAGKVTLEQVAEMQQLRQAGWTYRAIGERYGISRCAVKRRL